MIKILFAEDNPVVRSGVVNVLQKEPDLAVIGEAESGMEALDLLKKGLQPDILLTDFNMPQMTGLQLIQEIDDENLPAIVLTMHTNSVFLDKALAAGAKGYLLKNGDMEELLACIRDVHRGLVVIGKEFK
jgi:two-component system response regulator DegU